MSLNLQTSAFVFSTKAELSNTNKLLILIHGNGVVRAGQWSRNLIINHSLNKGTQFPYIEQAKQLGYEVLVLNTNDNQRIMNGKSYNTVNSGTAEAHAQNVWDRIITPAKNIRHIAIVAHSYGGTVTLNLAAYKFQEFQNRVSAIAFTDSVHYFKPDKRMLLSILKPVSIMVLMVFI